MKEGLDLRLMKPAKDTLIGFRVEEGFVNIMPNSTDAQGVTAGVGVPILQLTMEVANGEARRPVNVTLGMVLPIVHALTEWALRHSQATVSQ